MGRGGSTAMLVDHHCHLDAKDFAADLDGVVARARAAGVGLMVSISMHIRRLGETLAIAEAYPDVFCSVGTHPALRSHRTRHSRGGNRAPRRASQDRGDRRGRARLLLRQQPARGAGGRSAQAHRRGAGDAAAARHPCARRRRRHRRDPGGGDGEEALPGRAALLHRGAGPRPAGARPGAIHLLLRHLDVQEVGRAARHCCGRAHRPRAGGDGCTVPCTGQASGQAQ